MTNEPEIKRINDSPIIVEKIIRNKWGEPTTRTLYVLSPFPDQDQAYGRKPKSEGESQHLLRQ